MNVNNYLGKKQVVEEKAWTKFNGKCSKAV